MLINRKPTGTVVMLDNGDVSAFDLAGRLMYAAHRGRLLRAGLDGRVLEGGRILPYEEGEFLVEQIYETVRDLGFRRDPATAEKYRALYGSIPILPPDDYHAIYLQAQTGCPVQTCTFCTLYRDRTYRIRTTEEFEAHVDGVLDLLGPDVGRRKAVFLGDGNAIGLAMPSLIAMLDVVACTIPGKPVHGFADPTLHRTKTAQDLRDLHAVGLRRVTLGLETGHVPLRNRLHKPGTCEDLVRSVDRLRLADVAVGLSVLVGVGGAEYRDVHLTDTILLIRRLKPREGDFIYLSPLRGAGAPPDEEIRLQMESFRLRLATFPGIRVVPYDISKFLY